MRFMIITGSLALLGSSCSIYDSEFNCPPGEGIGCAAVGEVLEMIIENDSGEDDFIPFRRKPVVIKPESHNSGFGEEKLLVVRTEDGNLILAPEHRKANQ